jgi:hypothetical protein
MRYFDGLDLIDLRLVHLTRLRPANLRDAEQGERIAASSGAGRKP